MKREEQSTTNKKIKLVKDVQQHKPPTLPHVPDPAVNADFAEDAYKRFENHDNNGTRIDELEPEDIDSVHGAENCNGLQAEPITPKTSPPLTPDRWTHAAQRKALQRAQDRLPERPNRFTATSA